MPALRPPGPSCETACLYVPLGFGHRAPRSTPDEEDGSDENVQSFVPRVSPNQMTESLAFHLLVGVVILANTVVITMEAIYIHDQEVWENLQRTEGYFTILYVIELSWRLLENGPQSFFCTSQDWVWNWFDLAITISCVADESCSLYTGDKYQTGSDAGVSRTARLFRVMRILRPFRALRFLSEVDYVLLMTVRHLAKLSVIVALVIFVSAIVATNMLSDCKDPEVVAMFGDFWLSLWTMFQLMTLDSWIELTNRVLVVRPDMLVFFASYIFVASIAIMTLVPAIFIELSQLGKSRTLDSPRSHNWLSPLNRSFSSECKRQFFGVNHALEKGPRSRQISPAGDDDAPEEHRQHLSLRHAQQGQVRLLQRVFSLSDPECTGLASVEHMQQSLRDESVLQTLWNAGSRSEGELYDAQLILFQCWEQRCSGRAPGGPQDMQISEAELLEGINYINGDASQVLIWRSCTSTRMQMQLLQRRLCTELSDVVCRMDRQVVGSMELLQTMQAQVKSIREQTAGTISQMQASLDAHITAAESAARTTNSDIATTMSKLTLTAEGLQSKAISVAGLQAVVEAASEQILELRGHLSFRSHQDDQPAMFAKNSQEANLLDSQPQKIEVEMLLDDTAVRKQNEVDALATASNKSIMPNETKSDMESSERQHNQLENLDSMSVESATVSHAVQPGSTFCTSVQTLPAATFLRE